ncbi:D-alanyl-D-alanine carboxypeptidase/D-alanyl-D-alanine endopeptidase [Polymorphobacter fuscus]|uniref:D-alanyl-D-alanine carboxypeptidase/D-alanyl-D-alanine-endopeptidase n=1 Tax=Sandarakinorhabdus fusca TaxID=1439888 RepID=A0A7C9GV28_9SPHN|nr:D-alanyl-D-alanine carboxypeptidase/D-alanyl-D-alanine-endopeptidase [Polymorphobacter fuscus]KAB7647933.1 D-alanyl-D-alanine carboxypeptidase/D-alanyl-D-alanine-endopeptidase [Polymorphobacter fuscus]MQT17258.1 D-alanyl-D-alanine carboxypeptidase/D-alanyl-D-alanine-endopeptidase [Polymorphobacter fuscus]NJC08747.1 D-alanyl-D-alanine carboxypeptidase/D-alanyl-D-alanine-endopeptidase (penicillin-binding protein 4) [Polymorphobacter fuscus]
MHYGWLLLSLAAPVAAAPDPALLPRVEAVLAQGPAGTRYGLMVTTLDGEPLLAIAPDQRFIPASNTKMFVTATAYADLPTLQQAATGTGVRLETVDNDAIDVVLHGRGDALLASAAGCTSDCLQTLADAVAARTRRVRNVIGDDSWFPAERWGPGMSWNNIESRYGTGISALTLDDNEIAATVTPGAIGTTPAVVAAPYYRIDNRLLTIAGKDRAITTERAPNTDLVRLTGTIGVEAPPATLYFSLDDPAHYAAWRMRDLLRERGVAVTGAIATRHRPLAPSDDPAIRGGAPAPRPPQPEMLAVLPAPPLADDMRIINKQSQNLHADLMLRRVARQSGSGSIADGQAVLHRQMTQARLPADSFTFADGSGMSSYNRVTPRAAVTLLGWIARQPWGTAWRETLPIAGVDGTLRNRFKGSALEGKLLAKTGSLNAARALSGYFISRSGQTLVFSALANDMPDGTDAEASAAVDRAMVVIAEAF